MIFHPSPQKQPKSGRMIKSSQLLSRPYLLFDAGGTLVFPDQPFLIEQARAQGIKLTGEQLFAGYCRLIHALDCQACQSGSLPSPSLWHRDFTYVYDLFEILGLAGSAAQAVAQAVKDRCTAKCPSLWAFTFPRIRKALSLLKDQGYRMSVISNSNGRTTSTLSHAGLGDHFFDRIFTSDELGFEKPDPTIFEVILREMNRHPADVLYVGDIFYVDVLGANRAGIGALHLDPLGLYSGWPGVHLSDVSYLPDWLAHYAIAPASFDLFPLQGSISSFPAMIPCINPTVEDTYECDARQVSAPPFPRTQTPVCRS
jgi:FMN phosphatase YigB (HAD superfamily)